MNNLCGGGGCGAAACGGITRMSSLVPGIDRIETPLPFTDAGFYSQLQAGASPEAALAALPAESQAAIYSATSPPAHRPFIHSMIGSQGME